MSPNSYGELVRGRGGDANRQLTGSGLGLGLSRTTMLKLLILLFWSACKTSGSNVNLHLDPGFVGGLKNVTVPEGRDVVLTCTVKNLEGHKVAWIHYDRSAILTVQSHVITRNPRIAVSHEGHRTWHLHIRNVHRADQGAYMCQINTAKAKTRLGYLNVVVPPRIEDNLSSGDKVRTEGSNVTLECQARGSPRPTVTWKREDGQNINIDKARNYSVPTVEGEVLNLYKVSRLDMGAYMCIASNGVPPAVSKRIQLGIDFPPMMWVPAQQSSALAGSSVTFTCFVEAHPDALTFWEKDKRMIQQNQRIMMTNMQGTPAYKVEMKLTINQLRGEDFGTYKCIAKNPRGQTDGSITLTEEIPPTTTTLEPPTTQPATTTTTKPRRRKKNKERHRRPDLNDLEEENWHQQREGRKNRQRHEKKKQDAESNYESDSWLNPKPSSAPSITVTILAGCDSALSVLIPVVVNFRHYGDLLWL